MPAGRPSRYSQRLADEILERVMLGEGIAGIARDEGMPSESMIYRWFLSVPEFRERYARAREVQQDRYAEDIVEIADDGRNDWVGDSPNPELVQRSKLRVDTRKWLMSKLAPKKYGDRLAIGGDPTAPAVKHEHEHAFNLAVLSREQLRLALDITDAALVDEPAEE